MITPDGEVLIKTFEGYYDKAYKCPAGIWTIGYGSTHIFGRAVQPGDAITRQQAEDQFTIDVWKFEQVVDKAVIVRINCNQRSALVSFTYNCGPENFLTSTLLRKLNSGHPELVGDEMMKWVRGGGRILPGLVRRRTAEAALFNAPL